MHAAFGNKGGATFFYFKGFSVQRHSSSSTNYLNKFSVICVIMRFYFFFNPDYKRALMFCFSIFFNINILEVAGIGLDLAWF